MRIWIDLSAPAHPVVFRPLVQRLRAAGHEVEVTARDFAQTLELAQLAGLDALAVGAHGGRSAGGKLRSLAGRSTALWRWARSRPRFDLAAAHGSNDLPIVARALRIPAVDLFDYEWATFQHMIGCRLARRVIVPDAIPPERLRRYGAGPRKLRRYPGLKEEYFLHDFEPDPGILEKRRRRSARASSSCCARRRSRRSTTASTTRSTPICSTASGSDPGVHAVVLPRLREQADELRRLALPSVIVPGARGRRPEPGLGLRSRDLGRGQHEPRGGRARRAGLHDVPGPHGRRRREAPARGQAAPPRSARATSRSSAATAAPRACAATRN